MKLVPYTYQVQKRLQKQIHTIRILMEGTRIWTESDLQSDPVKGALEPNGLFVERAYQDSDLHFFLIDAVKTDLSSMFDYRECEPDTEILCWNTFYLITEDYGSWINIPDAAPFLSTILKAHYVVSIENGTSK